MIKSLYDSLTQIDHTAHALSEPYARVHWKGLSGSALSFAWRALFTKVQTPILLLFQDKEEAAYVFNDLEQLLSEKQVMFYPSSYRRPYQIEETDNANILLRAEVLNRIAQRNKPFIMVSSMDALFEKVVRKAELEKNTLKLAVGDALSIDFVNEMLFEYHFKRVDFVSEPGEFSLRGGILDVFSFSNDHPYRIEFFGDEVESIRTFDVETQLSIETQKKISIIPNVENKVWQEQRQSFLEYIPKNTLLGLQNIEAFQTHLQQLFEKATDAFAKQKTTIKQLNPEDLFLQSSAFIRSIESFKTVEWASTPHFLPKQTIVFETKPQPSFNKQFELLLNYLKESHHRGFENYICCSSEHQAQRLHEIFESIGADYPEDHIQEYKTIVLPLYQGFTDENLRVVCFTDHQIFERYHKFQLKNTYSKKQSLSIKELTQLTVGDFVTHIDHGIGKFGGLQKIEVDGKWQEAIKLVYADNDIVYVSIHSLHKISKFNGKDGTVPKVHKLGSQAWKTLKQKTKTRVKQLAFNLIQLYAKRRAAQGFACAPDSYLQKELESSFIYEDTPDQMKATQEVKADMESDRPMDRLVCGDVGFGKTEVAIRAAFKAVDNGKQVAVLVPTTILAYQHFRTFSERLRDLPVTVSYLNRFRTAKERKATVDGLAQGKVDIVIGTHQLVSKDVQFKDLGLLIIDEEQKFGVNVKDKLKTLSTNVDTLTLTATPIPRTLQFSLMAARDLSVISTPPPNRYPIESQIIGFHEETIRDAVQYEIQRNGQVFFINNRIENIREIAGMIQRLVPDARIGIGHGQMDGKQLEALMLDFMNGAFDVLVATSIIESGLDVPNANTIFINNAHQFGLSDLHQMRGRVGRSNKKAFCYFIAPSLSLLTEEARKRLQALIQYGDLGSGFHIAMKDLEIRGAGDILGGEQSGFINEIGFETYQKIMNEAIEELKEQEFKDLYQTDQSLEDKTYVRELQMDTDFELLFPDTYINNIPERLAQYNQLSALTDENGLAAFEQQLVDRFGPLPEEAKDLLDSIRIKWLAVALGMERLIMKQGKMIAYFVGDQQSSFYQTQKFRNIIGYVQTYPQRCRMQEKQTKNGLRLQVSFELVIAVSKAHLRLKEMGEFVGI